MNSKILGVVLLVAGVCLLAFGWNASDSVADSVSEGFTGRFTDKTMWYLIGGAILTAAGLVRLLTGRAGRA